jgi:site-specific DNA-methyltransferase (adenine-specific)
LDQHDIFVRDARALAILNKVQAKKEESLTAILAVDKEFGMTSNWEGFRKVKRDGDIALYYNDKGKRLNGWMSRKSVPKSHHLVDFWKVLIPQAYGERGAIPAQVLGPTQIVAPPSVCTQTFLFIYVDSRKAAESAESYSKTRFFRFLISLRKITQHATRSTYTWVPQQTWDRTWTDADLYEKYGITKNEQDYIAMMVKELAA